MGSFQIFKKILENLLNDIKEKHPKKKDIQLPFRKRDSKIMKAISKDLLNQLLPQNPSKRLFTPGIIGLTNVGATCYMNATLQCFSNISRFRNNLLKIYQNYLNKNEKEKKLSFALAEVFQNLWINVKNKEYPPDNFKKVIGEMNSLFSGVSANDPKDLVLFLLETMHKELNNPPTIKMETNYLINNKDYYEVFKEFIQIFINENQSIVSEEFYGCFNSMTTCYNCPTTIHNIQLLNILFFPLEEVRKYMNSEKKIKIEDCFLHYEKKEIYPSFYCNECKKLTSAFNQSKLIYAPPTLIINLNRGKGLEFDVKIEFEEYLDIKDYVYAQDSPSFYELVGVICHFGSNDMGGHFIAYCKNSNNCEWYKYNDSEVLKIDFKEVKETRIPYVLFYSYIIQ